MATTSPIHKTTTSAYVNNEVRTIRGLLVDELATIILKVKSSQLEWGRDWDIVTLGRVKWFLFSMYFLVWVVAKTLYLITPISVRTHWWAYVWNLPVGDTNPAQIYYWSYLWVTSDLYQPLGFVISSTTALLLLVAYLKGQ